MFMKFFSGRPGTNASGVSIIAPFPSSRLRPLRRPAQPRFKPRPREAMIARSQKLWAQARSLILLLAVIGSLSFSPAALGEVPEVEAGEHPSPSVLAMRSTARTFTRPISNPSRRRS